VCAAAAEDFYNFLCDDLNPPDKRKSFWLHTRPCTIYSILLGTWYQQRMIGCYECERLYLGIALRRYIRQIVEDMQQPVT